MIQAPRSLDFCKLTMTRGNLCRCRLLLSKVKLTLLGEWVGKCMKYRLVRSADSEKSIRYASVIIRDISFKKRSGFATKIKNFLRLQNPLLLTLYFTDKCHLQCSSAKLVIGSHLSQGHWWWYILPMYYVWKCLKNVSFFCFFLTCCWCCLSFFDRAS